MVILQFLGSCALLNMMGALVHSRVAIGKPDALAVAPQRCTRSPP